MEPSESPCESPRDPELDAGILFCSDYVYFWGLRKHLSEPDSADMRQVAALRLMRSPSAARRPARDWLERFAVQCLLAVRGTQLSALPLDEEELSARPEMDPEWRERFERALSRLPPKEAEVVRRCMIQAISPAVVAHDLDMRVNHVHLLSSRARKKIQTYLQEEEE